LSTAPLSRSHARSVLNHSRDSLSVERPKVMASPLPRRASDTEEDDLWSVSVDDDDSSDEDYQHDEVRAQRAPPRRVRLTTAQIYVPHGTLEKRPVLCSV
jgi:hypothetical protein